MAQFTNTGAGPRGINLKDQNTVFLDPGATVELNKADVAQVHPEIKEGAKAAKETDKGN